MEMTTIYASEADYHADYSRVSNSMLSVFSRSIPHYADVYVHRKRAPDPPSAEMIFGSLFHCYLLEWNQCKKRYMTFDGTTGRSSKAFSEMADKAAMEGIELVTKDEVERAKRMASRCHDHQLIGRMLDSAEFREQAFVWRRPESSLELKSKIDLVYVIFGAGGIDGGDVGVVVDFKTASDPTPSSFGYSAGKYSYHRQAAFYLDAMQASNVSDSLGYKITRWEFVTVAVGKEAPFDSEIGIYRYTSDQIAAGRARYVALLMELDRCHRENDWSSRLRGVTDLVMPKFFLE